MQGLSPRILLAIPLSLICIFFGAGYLGCNGSIVNGPHIEEHTDEAILDRDFKIKTGQEVKVKGEDLKVKFAALLDDSRCPANVTCIWEGDANIRIGVKRENAEESEMELHTNPRFSQAGKYEQYMIRLIALDPYPRTEVERRGSDYVATLLIKKE